MTANSQVVRALVADGRADVGMAASRPDHTPNPGVRETELVDDAIVCAVPPGHPWAQRDHIGRERFLRTPMVVRDPSSNARWTVDAVLAADGLRAAAPLVEAPTPGAALAEARRRRAPVLLSRHIIAQTDFAVVDVDGPRLPPQLRARHPGLRRVDRRGACADRPHPRAHQDLAALRRPSCGTMRSSKTSSPCGR